MCLLVNAAKILHPNSISKFFSNYFRLKTQFPEKNKATRHLCSKTLQAKQKKVVEARVPPPPTNFSIYRFTRQCKYRDFFLQEHYCSRCRRCISTGCRAACGKRKGAIKRVSANHIHQELPLKISLIACQ